MIVCICKSINSAQVRDAVQRGATDVFEVSQELGLGTGCGRCVEFAERMINTELMLMESAMEVVA